MKKIISTTLALLLFISAKSYAQSQVDIRINEVLPVNISGIADENGNRCGWIELYNTAFGMVDVAGFYLTDNKDNPTRYMIPKGNTATVIPLRKYLVLYADGRPEAGLFHMNFTLVGVSSLYLFGSDGKTLIDEIHIPASLPHDKSFGRFIDGEGAHEPVNWSKQSLRKSSIDKKIGSDGGFAILDHPTPGNTNTTRIVETKSEKMQKLDPWGGILALTAMGVVFLCLIILFLSFSQIGKNAVKKQQQTKVSKQTPVKPATPVRITSKGSASAIDDEILAAIAVACHMYQNGIDNTVHDVESNVLTFNQEALRNSPWGARSLTLKQDPRS